MQMHEKGLMDDVDKVRIELLFEATIDRFSWEDSPHKGAILDNRNTANEHVVDTGCELHGICVGRLVR